MCFKKTAILSLIAAICISTTGYGQSTESGKFASHGEQKISQHRHGGHFRFHVPRHYGYGVRTYNPYAYLGPSGFEVASMIRARGEFNLLSAQARTQNAAAYRMELENNLQTLATRLERRRVNSEYRFGHLHANAEKRRAEALIAKATRPQTVEPTTGIVRWPLVLSTKHYEKARRPIDFVFAERAKVGRINPDHYQPMCDWIEQIKCELKDHINEFKMVDYIEAQAFLRDLIEEARLPEGNARKSFELVGIAK